MDDLARSTLNDLGRGLGLIVPRLLRDRCGCDPIQSLLVVGWIGYPG